MASNQRIKNIQAVMSYMTFHKFSDRKPLERRIELECGVTNKKASEYIDLLVMDGQLIQSGKYTVLAGWKLTDHPYPGTEAFTRYRVEQDIKEFNDRMKAKREGEAPHAELDPIEQGILSATTGSTPTHTCGSIRFPCKFCGKELCKDCAANHIEGDPQGECHACADGTGDEANP